MSLRMACEICSYIVRAYRVSGSCQTIRTNHSFTGTVGPTKKMTCTPAPARHDGAGQNLGGCDQVSVAFRIYLLLQRSHGSKPTDDGGHDAGNQKDHPDCWRHRKNRPSNRCEARCPRCGDPCRLALRRNPLRLEQADDMAIRTGWCVGSLSHVFAGSGRTNGASCDRGVRANGRRTRRRAAGSAVGSR